MTRPCSASRVLTGPNRDGRDGEVEHADPVGVVEPSRRGSDQPASCSMSMLTWVRRARKRSRVGVVELVGAHEARELAADLVAVAGVVEAGAGQGDDAGLGGQLAVAVAQVEGGQQLADGQVAGAAEDDEVGGRDGGGCGGGRSGIGEWGSSGRTGASLHRRRRYGCMQDRLCTFGIQKWDRTGHRGDDGWFNGAHVRRPGPATTGEVFSLIRDGRALTRSDVGRVTGLSRTAVAARVGALLESGLVVEGVDEDAVASTGGARRSGCGSTATRASCWPVRSGAAAPSSGSATSTATVLGGRPTSTRRSARRRRR